MLIARSPEKSDGGTNDNGNRRTGHTALRNNSVKFCGEVSCYLLPLICSCVPCCGSFRCAGPVHRHSRCLTSGRSHACKNGPPTFPRLLSSKADAVPGLP